VCWRSTAMMSSYQRPSPPSPWHDERMSDAARDAEKVYKGYEPVEEGKSITGSGAVADDPKGPKFVAGPSMSTGSSPAPRETQD
jgi:hypothetical protein